MAKVGALGLTVTKPHGDNERFDFIVCDRSGKPIKVQVRSAWSKTPHGGYRVSVRHQSQRTVLGYDVFVIYIAPLDAWYVIPASALYAGLFGIQVWPETVRVSRSQWTQYRSAWHILTGDPDDDTRSLGLTIHAAADDGKSSKLP